MKSVDATEETCSEVSAFSPQPSTDYKAIHESLGGSSNLGDRFVEGRLVVRRGFRETGHLSDVLAGCLDHGIGFFDHAAITEPVYRSAHGGDSSLTR
jgi:hypothetical protein